MSYQFAHLNVYSRKADKTGVNTDFVFGEVMREDGFVIMLNIQKSLCLHMVCQLQI